MTYTIDHAPDGSIVLHIDAHKPLILPTPINACNVAGRLATAAYIAATCGRDYCSGDAVGLPHKRLPLVTAYSIAQVLFSHGCSQSIGALAVAG